MQEKYFPFHDYYTTSLIGQPIEFEGCIIRHLRINFINRGSNQLNQKSIKSSLLIETNTNEVDGFEFTQYHLTSWPDHGVPNDVKSLLHILSLVRETMIKNRLFKENSGKNLSHQANNVKFKQLLKDDFLAVHCSAGCGRTGTIIAIDQVWTMIKEKQLVSNFSLYNVAQSLREQRIALIQTLSQYKYFAEAVAFLFENHLNTHISLELTSKITEHESSKPVDLPERLQDQNRFEEKASAKSKQALAQPLSNKMLPKPRNLCHKTSDIEFSSNHNYTKILNKSIEMSSSITPIKSTPTESKLDRNSNHFNSVKQKFNRFVPQMLSMFHNPTTQVIKKKNRTQSISSSARIPLSTSHPHIRPSDSYLRSESENETFMTKNEEKTYENFLPISECECEKTTQSDFVMVRQTNKETPKHYSNTLIKYTTTLSSSKTSIKLLEKENSISQDFENNEAFVLNDNLMNRKEAGSVCEFLRSKLNARLSINHSENEFSKQISLSLENNLFFLNSNKNIKLLDEDENFIPQVPARTKIKKLTESPPRLLISTLNNKDTKLTQPRKHNVLIEQMNVEQNKLKEVTLRNSTKSPLYRLESKNYKNSNLDNSLKQLENFEKVQDSHICTKHVENINSSHEITREKKLNVNFT
jgi:hypothetical protein